ncbi:hypothetical protein SDC9_156648 [bioreactor metagenome]|uniref:Uncharacterized protein n=1 Tax=bioreactor metagenome TaxID=1076179 RepID=A0A645F7N5_9ZZZZ
MYPDGPSIGIHRVRERLECEKRDADGKPRCMHSSRKPQNRQYLVYEKRRIFKIDQRSKRKNDRKNIERFLHRFRFCGGKQDRPGIDDECYTRHNKHKYGFAPGVEKKRPNQENRVSPPDVTADKIDRKHRGQEQQQECQA